MSDRYKKIKAEVSLARMKLNGKISHVILDLEWLMRRIDRLERALEMTATPKDMVHMVHPKCLCNGCVQKEVLQLND